MDLGNPFDAIVHHLLIRGMVGVSYWDEVPMVSTLVCMITYGIWSIVSHDIRLLDSHDFTKLLYYIISQPWENIELVQKLLVALTTSEIVSW